MTYAGGDQAMFTWNTGSGNHTANDIDSWVEFSRNPDPLSKDWTSESRGKMIRSKLDGGASTPELINAVGIDLVMAGLYGVQAKFDFRMEKGTWYWIACRDVIGCSANHTQPGQPPLRKIVLTSQAGPGPILRTARGDIEKRITRRYKGANHIRPRGCHKIGLVKVLCQTSWTTEHFVFKASATVTRKVGASSGKESTDVVIEERSSKRRR
jgi:hypothetical protein